MTDLKKYNPAFIANLNKQLAVYTTIGTPRIESPMWFQYERVTEGDCLRFKSSQVDYMFFEIPVDKEDRDSIKYSDHNPTYEHFRTLKYKHIKENWPTVYFELRPSEKPVSPIQPQIINVPDQKEDTDYQKQANDFLQDTKTTFSTSFKCHSYYFTEDKETRDIYTIVLKNSKHRYRFTFGQSIVNTGLNPSAYDVLACIQKYDVGTFDNFCSDFGYNTDSRTAYKMYKSVLKEWKNIELLFTPEQLVYLQEIQ